MSFYCQQVPETEDISNYVNLKGSLPALLNGFSAQQRSKNWIQRFFQVLDQNYIPCCQCSLYGVQVPLREIHQKSSIKIAPQKEMTKRTCHRQASHPLCPMRMTRKSSPYLFLIHLMPCSWGSTMRGQRWQEVRMVAFSVDILSAGSPSFCHAATSASSVSMVRGSRSGVTGMGT